MKGTPLTPEKRARVLQLLAEGLNAPQVAERMGITSKTVWKIKSRAKQAEGEK